MSEDNKPKMTFARALFIRLLELYGISDYELTKLEMMISKIQRAKMREYISNGLRLGWLINPTKQVEICRPNQEVEVLNYPTSLLGEDVLPGFVLYLANVLA